MLGKQLTFGWLKQNTFSIYNTSTINVLVVRKLKSQKSKILVQRRWNIQNRKTDKPKMRKKWECTFNSKNDMPFLHIA